MTKVIIEVKNLQDNDLLGKVVISKAGRDTGNYYIVIEQIDDNYVLLADGRLKTIEKPKKKKLKHLKMTDVLAADIREYIMSNKRILDVMIKKFLEGIV